MVKQKDKSMDNKQADLNELFKYISKTVDDAVSSRDFKELNKTVKSSIETAVHGFETMSKEWFSDQPEAWADRVRTKLAEGLKNVSYPETNPRPKPKPRPTPAVPLKPVFAPVIKGGVKGSFSLVLGSVFAAGCGIAAITLGALLLAGVGSVVLQVFTGTLAVATGLGIYWACSGKKELNLVRRFKQYRQVIEKRSAIAIDELAGCFGRKKDNVIADVEIMMKRRVLLQAKFSPDKQMLFLTDEAYRQHVESREKQQRQEQELKASGVTEEVMQILKQGEDYIAKIRQANDALPGEEISAKLARLELVISRIIREVKKQPKKAGELATFMNYYLPTTWKLLTAYMEFESQPIQTENVVTTKKEIETTIDTINAAFENLLDDLLEEKAWDIGAEISVLHTMFKQEGLTETSMKTKGEGHHE